MHTNLWLKDFGDKDNFVEVGPDGNILVILKRILNKLRLKIWI
jgi:hypothetical protein